MIYSLLSRSTAIKDSLIRDSEIHIHFFHGLTKKEKNLKKILASLTEKIPT